MKVSTRQSLALSVIGIAALSVLPAARGIPLRAVGATAPALGAPASTPRDVAWPEAAVSDPSSAGFTRAGLQALDARLRQSVAEGDTAGMTYVLLRRGQVAAFNSIGERAPGQPMTLDSIFRIYSMSKPITGVALMQLYDQGKFQLDDPVTKFLPELSQLRVVTSDARGNPVVGADGAPVLEALKKPPTMRQLMSHTAGFGYGLSDRDPVNRAFREKAVLGAPNLDELMRRVAGIPLLFQPGERWAYSVAVDIQGQIVAKLSGQRFGDYLKAHVTGPLGMRDTAFFVPADSKGRFTEVYHWDTQKQGMVMNPPRVDRGSYFDPNALESGGGGLVGTAHDYARFTQMLLNRGELGGVRILKPETVELMVQNHIGDLTVSFDGTTSREPSNAVGFGLDFAVYTKPGTPSLPFGKGTYSWGGAAGTWFWVDPANDLAFIGMIQNMGGNRPGAFNFRDGSARFVYGALASPATR